MTEHFEDFDPQKLQGYIDETHALTRSSGFVFVPGIEVNLQGVDTILFPIRKFADVESFAAQRGDSQLISVLAHPSKYPFDKVARHLQQFQLTGIELWNQQADSSYRPPVDFLNSFKRLPNRTDWRYFFGCDLHDVSLQPANILSLAESDAQGAESIVDALRSGRFMTSNLVTRIEYNNQLNSAQFDPWLDSVVAQGRSLGGVRWRTRQVLKRGFKLLPRTTQRGLNDFKNFVRNRA